MSRTKMEEKVNYEALDFEVDDETTSELPLQEIKIPEPTEVHENVKESSREETDNETPLINCLRNERVIIRHIPKEGGMITNPKHILFGGMAENAVRIFTVPRLSSGMFVNVLTDKEKAYLEEAMGLEYNALSVYKKVNNFWDDSNDSGISKVRLTKLDNYLNLADPEDYIRYKILLANKDYIAPSLEALQDSPKATYQFVIISEGDETRMAKDNMSSTMKCYKEYGKIENDVDTLRVLIEAIDGRPTSPGSQLEFLQTKANNLIQADSKLFLKTITDPLLKTKVLIKKSIEAGLISNRGNFLYLRSDNTPLCELNEEPTLNIAAKYLNSPKHQDIKFTLEAKTK
nr:MAG TPA: hypothetical protein [Crassvirales sp.]